MITLVSNHAVNHCTYLGVITQGTTACAKRGSARVGPEISLTMDRLTNLYKPLLGSEVPPYEFKVFSKGDMNYVVFVSLNQPKRTFSSRGLQGEGPKVSYRRMALEFGIPRELLERRTLHYTRTKGVRRFHITSFISGKETSLDAGWNSKLSGFEGISELNQLLEDIKNKSRITYLSSIMANPEFLIGCWAKIKSNKGSLTPALTKETLDGIDRKWFEKSSNQMINGKFAFNLSRRTYIPKPGKRKMRPLTIPDPRDKVIQEAMRFLLELIFEPSFRDSSHGFRPKRGCSTALNQIRMKFGSVHWFIEGDIDQQFPSIDHSILVGLIEQKVKDQAFIDLLYKYLRVGYGEENGIITPMRNGLVQGGVLSPLLSNIYMSPFDEWMEDTVVPEFNEGTRRKANPEYSKIIRSGSGALARKKYIRSTLGNDPNFKRIKYVRYADDFIIGISGSRADCTEIRTKIRDFLKENLKLNLNLDKTKITHASYESALFLGYRVHITKVFKMPVRKNAKGTVTRLTPRPVLDAPIAERVKQLCETGFARRGGVPTRNGKFINLSLPDLINHFRAIERGVLNYYAIANNFGRMAARIHYILKYSCALTIASKMKLHTLKKVFSKYGKDLTIIDGKGEVLASYPTASYRRKRGGNPTTNIQAEKLILELSNRVGRGRKDIKGPCSRCGSKEFIEIHHVKSLSKRKLKRKPDWLLDLMIRMNRKQIPLCRTCHIMYHRGEG